MDKCKICEKKTNQEENKDFKLADECFKLHKVVADLHFFQQKLLPQLESNYPTQCAKLKPFISKMETLTKEQVEPNVKKIEQVLKSFFKSKGKIINHYYEDYWISPICEDCEEELKKQIKSAVDDIERARLESKFREASQEGEQIINQIPNSENLFDEEKYKDFQFDYINKEIDKLNKEIIAEREREQKWEGWKLETVSYRY